MDILRVLSSPDLEVRRKTLSLAMDLVTSRNIEEMVLVLKKVRRHLKHFISFFLFVFVFFFLKHCFNIKKSPFEKPCLCELNWSQSYDRELPATPRVAWCVLKTKMFSYTIKNALS
jgi:hypothetical protein